MKETKDLDENIISVECDCGHVFYPDLKFIGVTLCEKENNYLKIMKGEN